MGIGIAHKVVFGRIDYDRYDSEHYLLCSDIDKEQYPRKTLQIQSGENALAGYLYFVDNDWKVLCYDYTGSYSSQGSSMVGYTQSVHDLDNVLTYVESNDDYKNIPVDIPVLVISGSDDVFYGGDSPIYEQRNNITNPNCSFEYKTESNHNGHYDYFLSDEALQYQSFIENETFTGKIDKNLYAQHDISFMKHLNDFLLKTIL